MKHQPQSTALVEFGPFGFDKAHGKLSKHGTPIRLGGMPLKILRHLVERAGEPVSRGELQTLLWNGSSYGDFEQGLNTAVNVVRKTLSDSADQPRYIETIPGQGYRFIAPLRSLADVQQASGPKAASPGAVPDLRSRKLFQWIIAAVAVAVTLGGAWWTFRPKPQTLIDGSTPSANREANDQYNLAFNFLAFQNDIPLSTKTFAHALELDPQFASARLQHVNSMIIEIYNGYSNDGSILLQAEEELHLAEKMLPDSDGLLLAAQTAVYFAQGRLDHMPRSKLEENYRKGGNPTWPVILRILEGQTDITLATLRARLERNPLEATSRMFLGELLRMQGDTAGAIQTLERVLQQGPRLVAAAWFLTMAYLDAGKQEQARALLERMRPEFSKNYMWRHAWALLLAVEGKHEEARQGMDEGTLSFARLNWAVTSTTADFYALQGDRTKAIEWLQLAVARGDERVAYFRRDPRLAMLQSDARFLSLVNSLEARRSK